MAEERSRDGSKLRRCCRHFVWCVGVADVYADVDCAMDEDVSKASAESGVIAVEVCVSIVVRVGEGGFRYRAIDGSLGFSGGGRQRDRQDGEGERESQHEAHVGCPDRWNV